MNTISYEIIGSNLKFTKISDLVRGSNLKNQQAAVKEIITSKYDKVLLKDDEAILLFDFDLINEQDKYYRMFIRLIDNDFDQETQKYALQTLTNYIFELYDSSEVNGIFVLTSQKDSKKVEILLSSGYHFEDKMEPSVEAAKEASGKSFVLSCYPNYK